MQELNDQRVEGAYFQDNTVLYKICEVVNITSIVQTVFLYLFTFSSNGIGIVCVCSCHCSISSSCVCRCFVHCNSTHFIWLK